MFLKTHHLFVCFLCFRWKNNRVALKFNNMKKQLRWTNSKSGWQTWVHVVTSHLSFESVKKKTHKNILKNQLITKNGCEYTYKWYTEEILVGIYCKHHYFYPFFLKKKNMISGSFYQISTYRPNSFIGSIVIVLVLYWWVFSYFQFFVLFCLLQTKTFQLPGT